MKRSRIKKSEVAKNADWGAYVLLIIVIIIGFLAYFADCLGSNWKNVLEIVGAPFSLGVGFFAFERAFDSLWAYKDNNKEDDD